MNSLVAEAMPTAACFGSPGVDLLPTAGVVGPNHVPGAKTTELSSGDVAWIEKNLQGLGTAEGVMARPSGGVLSVFARLAVLRNGAAKLVAVVGDNSDPASRFLRPDLKQLEALGADCSYIQTIGGYTIQASIVEKAFREDGTIGNRMIRIREGMPKAEYLGATCVAAACENTNLVVLAGVKDMELSECILEQAPENSFVAGCWGTCDLVASIDEVRGQMGQRPFDLLSANEYEAGAILGKDKADDIEDAKRHAADLSAKYARFAMCTLAEGIAYAHDGFADFEEALPDPPGGVHTLGAGDSVLAVAAHYLSLGYPIDEAAREASRTANKVIRYRGAYDDLDYKIRAATKLVRA